MDMRASTLIAAPPSPPLRVELEARPDPALLEPEWTALEERAGASFFLSWHWIGCWLRSQAPEVVLLRVRLGERTVGLGLLCWREERRHGVLRVPTLHLNATGDELLDVLTIEYNDMLAEEGLRDQVRSAALGWLRGARRVAGRPFWALQVRGTTEPVRVAGEAAGFRARLHAKAPSAAVDLAAVRASGRSYLQHVSGNTRSQIRRAARLYEMRGKLRLETARDTAEALAFLEAAGELHQARWQARGRPGAYASPTYVAFHRSLVAAAHPAGAVELLRVRAGDETVGYLYNFVWRGRVYFYLCGFRYEEDNRLKPGLVSHWLCIERHLAGGAELYDFMAGDNRYKTSLGTPGPDIVTAIMEKPHPALRAENLLRRLRARLRR
ncbi:GNAT family N-acetyltransferase [Geminicoccaceae bacterium 1502E]|nr:GNAT family N-acetyltransferase [Geminicoccaceae bacterium 1502E]